MGSVYLKVIAIAFTFMLGGCQSLNLFPREPKPLPEPDRAEKFRVAMDTVLMSLARRGDDASLPKDGDPRWDAITAEGFWYVNGVCNDYIVDLHHAKRNYDALRGGVSATETASTAVLSATLGKADVQKTVQVPAGLFGLSQGLLTTSEKSVLYDLPPSEISSLWGKVAGTYVTAYDRLPIAETQPEAERRYSKFGRRSYTRAEAIGHISQYLSLCLPTNLESYVIQAIRSAKVADTANPEVDCSKDENKNNDACKKPETPLPTKEECAKPQNADTDACKALALKEFCAKPENKGDAKCEGTLGLPPTGGRSPERGRTTSTSMPNPMVVP